MRFYLSQLGNSKVAPCLFVVSKGSTKSCYFALNPHMNTERDRTANESPSLVHTFLPSPSVTLGAVSKHCCEGIAWGDWGGSKLFFIQGKQRMIQEFYKFCVFLNRMIHIALQVYWWIHRMVFKQKPQSPSRLAPEDFCFPGRAKLCHLWGCLGYTSISVKIIITEVVTLQRVLISNSG